MAGRFSVKKAIYAAMGLLIVCISVLAYLSSLKEAVFINVRPTIKMEDIEYLVTTETISKDMLGRQVGRVTQVVELVSYPESNNPYKKPRRIFEINGKSIKEEVALEMNGKFHIARLMD